MLPIREGALDDARQLLLRATQDIGEIKPEEKVRLMLRKASVERAAGRMHDASKICQEAMPVADLIDNHEVGTISRSARITVYASWT